MQAVSEDPYGLLLRFELQIAENRELRGLRGHHSHGRLPRVLQVAMERFRKAREIAHHRGFRFFRAICSHGANGRLVGFRHVAIRVP